MSKKILVRAPNWLGDAIMSIPFIKNLLKSHPDAQVDILSRPSTKELYESLPGIHKVIILDPTISLLPMAKIIKKNAYDVSYILPPSFSSAWLFWLARIPERIGYGTDFRSFFLTQTFSLDERLHYVRRYLGLLNKEGTEIKNSDFFFPSPEPEKMKTFSKENNLPENLSQCLAIAPGSRAPARRWFPDRFAHLANKIQEKDKTTVLLLGAPEDRPFCKEVEKQIKQPVLNLCGKTSLLIAGNILRQCRYLITNESGMMHIAWAVGTPTLVLSGASNKYRTSPFGPKNKIIQHQEVPCVPCVQNECFRVGDEYKECMKRIEVDEVLEAVQAFEAETVF